MRFLITLVLLTIAFSFSNCKKPIPGCTDQDAENFYYEAEEDDGTCSYRGSAVFYHGEQTSQNLLNAGVTNVKLYVNDQFMDAMSPNVYFDFVPTCSHPDAMNMENYGIGNSTTQSFGYTIEDQNGNILDAGIFNINGNSCNTIEYQY